MPTNYYDDAVPYRAPVLLPNNEIATVRSIGVGDERGEWVIPTIVEGKPVDVKTAIKLWNEGKNPALGGPFGSPEAGKAFAEAFHQKEAQRLGLSPPSGLSLHRRVPTQ